MASVLWTGGNGKQGCQGQQACDWVCSPPVEEGAALPVVPQNGSPRTMSSEYKYCNLTSESRITGAPSVYVAVLNYGTQVVRKSVPQRRMGAEMWQRLPPAVCPHGRCDASSFL